MKTAIFAIALIASGTASAFKANHAHKDWTWSSEMNDHGAFVTSTMSKEKIDGKSTGMFMFVAVPEGGECQLSYSILHFGKKHADDGTVGTTEIYEGIPVFYRIDKKRGWKDEVNISISTEETYNSINYKASANNNGKFMSEMLKGTKLYVASNYKMDEGPTTESTFSLMGSSVAMNAIYSRCKDHLTAFPNYNANKDSRSAMQRKQKSKAKQAVADKAESI